MQQYVFHSSVISNVNIPPSYGNWLIIELFPRRYAACLVYRFGKCWRILLKITEFDLFCSEKIDWQFICVCDHPFGALQTSSSAHPLPPLPPNHSVHHSADRMNGTLFAFLRWADFVLRNKLIRFAPWRFPIPWDARLLKEQICHPANVWVLLRHWVGSHSSMAEIRASSPWPENNEQLFEQSDMHTLRPAHT